jgi:hypothetical protein
MKKPVSKFTVVIIFLLVGVVLSLILKYTMHSSRLQGAVVIPPPPTPCPSRGFTSCTQVPNTGSPAGCLDVPPQYCGLGFGLTGFVCKCKNSGSTGTSSSFATISSPPSISSAAYSPPVASGPFCCETFIQPAPLPPKLVVCIPVGPSRCGAGLGSSVATYSSPNCGGNCPAP